MVRAKENPSTDEQQRDENERGNMTALITGL